MKTVALVPIKLNNERMPGKNIKKFHNGQPLIHYILETLKTVSNLDEIYVYCSSDEILQYIPDGVSYLKRDPYYDLSTTVFNEVINSFCELVKADVYVLAHATAPFVEKESFEKGIEAVVNGEHDSAFAVTEMQEFIWKDGKPFNYSLDNIPRTQDLDKLQVETCGMYIFKRELMIEKRQRIGENSIPIVVSKVEACDINTQEDFELADAIYNYKVMLKKEVK